jgi:hypothetical protein
VRRWQYLPAWALYTLVTALNIPLMLRHRLTLPHLMLANPTLPWGGMEIGSKIEIMERFRGAPQFLDQMPLPVERGIEENLTAVRERLRDDGIRYPAVAKPDCGCVGFGVAVVRCEDDLRAVLERTPVDYLLQEHAGESEEFGAFFTKGPGETQGRIIGLAHKEIPTVTGDGRSSLRTLVESDPRFEANRAAVLAHARGLERTPAHGETVQLLVQASHTYGAWFRDITDQVTPELTAWVNAFMGRDPEVRHGRLDIRAPDLEALQSGREAKVIEVNGCLSEPIHVYDDDHSLWFGLAGFYRTYRDAYRAAAANRGRVPVPLWTMYREYRRFFRGKAAVTERIG